MKYLLNKEETTRINFRSIELTDFNTWIEFFKDPSSFAHWTSKRKSHDIECKEWYDKQFNRYETDLGGMNALIEKATGKLVGHAGLLVQYVDDQEELEVAYSLLPDFHNKGYATEVAIKCRDYAFENNFAESLISIISITNTTSSNVAGKNGMTLEKQTMYHENRVNIFRIQNSEWKALH